MNIKIKKLYLFFKLLPFFVLILLLMFFSTSMILSQNFPEPVGFVNDFANLIDNQTKLNIEKLAYAVKKNTGGEIAIVTLDDIGNFSIEEYAAELFKNWGIGEKGKDNGILVLLALKQRKIRIEVGYGLEGDFPDILMNTYLNKYAIPYFKNGEYSKGFYSLTYALANHFAKINNVDLKKWIESENLPEVKTKEDRSFISNIFGLIFFLLFFVFPFIGFFGRRYLYSRRVSNPLLWAMLFGGMSNRGSRYSNLNGSGDSDFTGFGGFGGFGGGASGGGGATGSF